MKVTVGEILFWLGFFGIGGGIGAVIGGLVWWMSSSLWWGVGVGAVIAAVVLAFMFFVMSMVKVQ